jgi:hypothetical protein
MGFGAPASETMRRFPNLIQPNSRASREHVSKITQRSAPQRRGEKRDRGRRGTGARRGVDTFRSVAFGRVSHHAWIPC